MNKKKERFSKASLHKEIKITDNLKSYRIFIIPYFQ